MSSWLFKAFSIPLENASSIAIQTEEEILSYETLSILVDKKALELQKQGIFTGSRVAFVANSNLSCIITILSLFLLKATPCPLSFRLPKEALPSLLEKARISFFIDIKSSYLQKLPSQDSLPPAILLYTSGSSGHPKLVSLDFSHFMESALGSAPFLDLNLGTWLLSVPLFHVSGLSILFRCLTTTSTILLAPFFSPLSSLASHLSLVPTQLQRLLENTQHFPSLRCLLLGGAPISEALLQKAILKKLPVRTTYGLTETASQVTMSLPSDSLSPLHLGKPLPGRELMIDETGEILVRGKTLFSGYDLGSKPVLPLTQAGWFSTGDLGALTKEGHLLYKGRKDNLFISGGENIHPEEIEKVLNTIPDIIASVVIPIDDLEYGKRPVAFLHTNSSLPSKEALQEALSLKLPKFCIPIHFFPFPEDLKQDLKIQRKKFQVPFLY
ncbi:MAG: AMP-binding protein [Chlamydiota bacterium]